MCITSFLLGCRVEWSSWRTGYIITWDSLSLFLNQVCGKMKPTQSALYKSIHRKLHSTAYILYSVCTVKIKILVYTILLTSKSCFQSQSEVGEESDYSSAACICTLMQSCPYITAVMFGCGIPVEQLRVFDVERKQKLAQFPSIIFHHSFTLHTLCLWAFTLRDQLCAFSLQIK